MIINELRKDSEEREGKISEIEKDMKEEKKKVKSEIDKMTLMIEKANKKEV